MARCDKNHFFTLPCLHNYYVSAREDVKQQATSNVMITLGVS